MTRSLALAIALLAALTPAAAQAQMEWVGPLAPPGPVEVPGGGFVVELPADWEVRGVSQASIVELAESSSLDPEMWRPVVFGLDVRDDQFSFCLVAEGGGWGHNNPIAEMPDLAKALRDAGHSVKRFDWPDGQAIKLSSDDGTSIYVKEGLSWAQVACGGTSTVPDEIVEDIASSLRFIPVVQQQAAAAQPSSSRSSGNGDAGVLVLIAVVFMVAVAVLLLRGRRTTPAPAPVSRRSSGARAPAMDKRSPTPSSGATPSGEPQGEIVVESYPGRTQADAAVVFAKRAKFMASRGYSPVSQSWSEGRPGVKRVVMLGVFANSIRPDGHLTVTYQRTIPAATSAPANETTERAFETDASRPSVSPQPEPEAAPTPTESLGTRDTGHAEPQRDTKTCPDCAETILEAARICRFCRYEFWSADALPPSSKVIEEPEATTAVPVDMPSTSEAVPERQQEQPEPEPPPSEPVAPSPTPEPPPPAAEPSASQPEPEPQAPVPPASPPGGPPPPQYAPQQPPYPPQQSHTPPPPTWQPPPQGQQPPQGPPGQGPGTWAPPPPTRPPDRPR